MMRLCLLLALGALTSEVHGQDRILTKDSGEITVRVLKEEKKDIVYFDWGDPSRELKRMPKKEVRKVYYEEPPYGSDLIILRMDSLSGRDLFSDILGFLIRDGYEIEVFYKDDLKVTTKFNVNRRITLEVSDSKAILKGYGAKDKEVEFAPSTGTKATIKLVEPNKSEAEKKFPGEVRARSGGRAFEEIDRTGRNYLLERRGVLSYATEE